jgi:hypothetical protein
VVIVIGSCFPVVFGRAGASHICIGRERVEGLLIRIAEEENELPKNKEFVSNKPPKVRRENGN